MYFRNLKMQNGYMHLNKIYDKDRDLCRKKIPYIK